MKTIGIRTLKSQISEYLRAAQSSERVTIIRRGTTVADQVPHTPHGLDPDGEPLRMSGEGKIQLGNSNANVPRLSKEHRWAGSMQTGDAVFMLISAPSCPGSSANFPEAECRSCWRLRLIILTSDLTPFPESIAT